MREILCIGSTAHNFIPFFTAIAKHLFGRTGTAVRKSKNPRLVVYSFFSIKPAQRKVLRHYFGKVPVIFISGEAYDCSKKKYQLLLDTKLVPKLRNSKKKFSYLPFCALSFCERRMHSPRSMILRPAVPQKTKFCAFMYGHEVPFRNSLFDQLSAYKQVDALGKCRNLDKDLKGDRDFYSQELTYFDIAVQRYAPYQFVICCENTKQRGYVTEKIINAFLARCIPIYCGCPNIGKMFNPKAFINVSQSANWVQEVRELHENPEKLQNMLQEPCFSNNKLPHYYNPKHTAKAIKLLLKK